MARFDLNGTWNMESVEGIEGFVADSGASWLKRMAAVKVLGASRNPRRFEQHGSSIKAAVRRKGKWQEDEFVADGERIYGEETNGVRMWTRRYWDSEGWLVDESQNHEGQLRTRFGLLNANTMQMRVNLVVDPPSGNEMVRVYSRDGQPLPANAAIPRCEPDQPKKVVEMPPTNVPGPEPTPHAAKSLAEPGSRPAATAECAAGAAEAAMETGATPSNETALPLGLTAEKGTRRGAVASASASAENRLEDTVRERKELSETEGLPPGLPPPVVFIHGIMGSTLVDADGSTHYLSLSHTIGITSPDLALPTSWARAPLHDNSHKGHTLPRQDIDGEHWVQGSDGLHPGEVLRNVGPVAVYGPFLEWLVDTMDDATTFAYDWRRDNNESTDRFIRYLEQIKQCHGGRAPQVIAHSNGGLVSLAALNERPELFHSVLFCGVPFGPGCSYVEEMHTHGKQKYGLNTHILRPDVMCTHSSYLTFFATSLLSEGEEFAHNERVDTCLIGPGGETINPIGEDCTTDYGGAWERFGLGPFRATGEMARLVDSGLRERRRDECRAHLAHATKAARRFRERLRGRPAKHYQNTPIGILNSRAFRTRVRGHVNIGSNQAVDTELKYELGDGDGSVAYAMSFPPRSCGDATVHYESTANHLGIMSDFAGLEHCLLTLQKVVASRKQSGVCTRLRLRVSNHKKSQDDIAGGAQVDLLHQQLLHNASALESALLACAAVIVLSCCALIE